MSCQQDAIELLREGGFRLTPQRAMVLDAIYHNDGHLTVDEVYERVQRQSSFVDLSTIYRTLQFLKQHGLIGELRVDGEAVRYEAVRSGQEHHHALCSGCGLMFDMEPADLDALAQILRQRYGFAVNPVHMIIPGLCASCAG